VTDDFAGGSADCRNCQVSIRVPSESDPEVVLVFKAGDSEDGVAMTREQVTAAFEANALLPTDLVLDNGTWRPLAAQLHAEDAAATLGDKKDDLRLRLTDPETGEEKVLHKLPHIRLERPIYTEEDEAEQRRKIHFSLLRVGDESPTGEPAEESELEEMEGGPAKPVLPKKFALKRTLLISGQLLAGLLALWYGYKLGIGPLISSIRGLPTRVTVLNPGKADYTAVLGWRRLRRDLPKGAACFFELYVGMRERQALKLTPKGGGPSIKIKVPLRPGGKILVNPKGAVHLVAFHPEKAGRVSMREVVDVLREEIKQNVMPDAAGVLIELLAELSKNVVGEPVRGELLDAAAYRFGAGFEGGLPMAAVKPDAKKKKKSGPPLPLLARSDRAQRVNFREGYALVRAAVPDAVSGAVRLEATTVSLPAHLMVKIPKNAELKLKREGRKQNLALDVPNQTITPRKTKFLGQWQFRAWSGGNGRWGWVWVFRGQGKIKGKPKKLTLRLKNGGQVPLVEWK